jgi:hypothetical protein
MDRDGYLQKFSYLDIFVLDTFLATSDEPPQHYRPQMVREMHIS